MKHNKKAFELSINFLVTMIIMVVIFSFGIYLFTNVFNQAVKMDTEIHEQEMSKLAELLEDGSLVSVLNPNKTYGKDALRFPMGITNENGAASNNFQIEMDKCNFTPNEGVSNDINCDDVVQYFSDDFEIKNNERKYRLILITPKKSGGFYAIKFHIKRCEFPDSGGSFTGAAITPPSCDWNTYGGTQMIMVTVP